MNYKYFMDYYLCIPHILFTFHAFCSWKHLMSGFCTGLHTDVGVYLLIYIFNYGCASQLKIANPGLWVNSIHFFLTGLLE